MKTAVETLLAVLDVGGRLDPTEGNRLRAMLPTDCPAELREAIRVHKTGLLALLASPPFIVVRSNILQPEFLLWVATDHDRDSLISLGVPSGVVYTREELGVIVERNPNANVLSVLHKCKRTLSSKIISRCPG